MILFQPDLNRFDDMLVFAQSHFLGFELMDFSLPAVLDDDSAAERILKLCAGHPVKSVHGPFMDINFSGSDPEILRPTIKRLEKCAQYTALLGAKRMVVHSCFFPIMPPGDRLYDLWSKTSAELLIKISEDFGIEICIENLLDITPDIILNMIKTANHPGVRACLDIGHANLSRRHANAWIKMLAPYITHVHLCDNGGMYDDHLAFGEGNIDMGLIDRLLKEHSVAADYTIEVKPFEAVVKSIKFIKNGGMPYVFS